MQPGAMRAKMRGMSLVSDKGVIQQLATLMCAHGISRCVLCPGSRNSPIVGTLAALPGMECRSICDERSAGFVALGWALQCGEPVAVCVTSGSALLNLHPAVAEASYRHVPLLILSADRPAAWINQQDGQTLPQPGVYGTLVRFSAQLPEEDSWHANRLINEAMLALRHRAGGPVHLNIPLSEPFFGMSERPLPSVRIIRRTEAARMTADDETALLAEIAACPRRMLLLGQMTTLPKLPLEELKKKGFVIIGEHLSQLGQQGVTRPDTLPGTQLKSGMAPDLLITYGGDIISKRMKRLLRSYPPRQHWHISLDGAVVDTFCCVTRILEGEPAEFLEMVAAFAEEGDADFPKIWYTPPTTFPRETYCGMSLVGDVLEKIPAGSILHLGNSSAVRYAQLFPLPPGIRVECNRGINGIEGSLSTALGYAAAAPEQLHIIIIGDLSFFYDVNALLAFRELPNVRILLLNNHCGGIFHLLPGIPTAPEVSAPHGLSAETCTPSGMRYRQVHHAEDWAKTLPLLLSTAPGAVLVEAFTEASQDASLLKDFYNHH